MSVSPCSSGHKGSRKAVLLRLDQDTSSPSFVNAVGGERIVTLIAVSKSDTFDEWASSTGHVSCDCNQKACRAPIGAEYEALTSARKIAKVEAAEVKQSVAEEADEVAGAGTVAGARRSLLKATKGSAKKEKGSAAGSLGVYREHAAPDFCDADYY